MCFTLTETPDRRESRRAGPTFRSGSWSHRRPPSGPKRGRTKVRRDMVGSRWCTRVRQEWAVIACCSCCTWWSGSGSSACPGDWSIATRRCGRSAAGGGAIGGDAGVARRALLPGVVDGEVRTSHVAWITTLGVDLDLRLDGIGRADARCSSPASACSSSPTRGATSRTPTPSEVRLLGLLVLFAGAMVGLVLADNLFILYGFWELTSVTSFLLIGNRSRRRPGPGRRAPGAARHRRSARWRCWPGSSSSARPPAPIA